MTADQKVSALARVLRMILNLQAVRTFMPRALWAEADTTLSEIERS